MTTTDQTPALFDPAGMATMGGRGKDPALMAQIAELRNAPPRHLLHVASTQTWSTPTPDLTAREAFEIRVKRLREAGHPHEADRDALTITYAREADGITTTVHLRYTEPEEAAS
jgi:uncharacterized protein YndB with AHSA1/START domain